MQFIIKRLVMNINKQRTEVVFHESVELALSAIPRNQQLAEMFLSKEIGRPRYVVGRNVQAAELLSLAHVDGVIDDYENNLTLWNGIPIVKTSQISENAIVVNCSTSISPVAVQEVLTNAGVENIVAINEVIHASKGKISLPWFVSQQREDYQSHKLDWKGLYQSMADAVSRKTLLDVVRYRLTADSKYMQDYSVRLKEQYFEDFMALKTEVFVDAGGFDGDTTEEFCRRHQDYKKVFFFEPSLNNMQAAKIRLVPFSNIEFMKVGLSDEEGQLHFNPDAGSASAVSDAGNETINVTTLDMAINEPVSFIKMDIEGWEMKALYGCARHIKEDKPKLAISVYHSASDFREVPRYIMSLNPDYRVYLRHYTQGWSETVMYFN